MWADDDVWIVTAKLLVAEEVCAVDLDTAAKIDGCAKVVSVGKGPAAFNHEFGPVELGSKQKETCAGNQRTVSGAACAVVFLRIQPSCVLGPMDGL